MQVTYFYMFEMFMQRHDVFLLSVKRMHEAKSFIIEQLNFKVQVVSSARSRINDTTPLFVKVVCFD